MNPGRCRRGGGRLVVPAGVRLTGPIGLKSRIELYVDKKRKVSSDQWKVVLRSVASAYKNQNGRNSN